MGLIMTAWAGLRETPQWQAAPQHLHWGGGGRDTVTLQDQRKGVTGSQEKVVQRQAVTFSDRTQATWDNLERKEQENIQPSQPLPPPAHSPPGLPIGRAKAEARGPRSLCGPHRPAARVENEVGKGRETFWGERPETMSVEHVGLPCSF